MQKPQEQATHMFRKVVAFVDGHPELTQLDTAQGRTFAARRDALDSIVTAVEVANTAQVRSKIDWGLQASNHAELKRQLCVQLKSIAEVARGLSKTVPGIGTLRMPDPKIRNKTFIDRANAFAEQATVYESVLVEHGLHEEFIPQLKAAIEAFQACLVSREMARSQLATASSAVQHHIAVGRSIVVGMNGVLHRVFDGQKDALAGWLKAKHVDRLPARPQPLAGDSTSPAVHAASPSAQATSPVVQATSPHAQVTSPVDSTGVSSAQRAA